MNVSVKLCRTGYVLEADPVQIYKCVPCLAGAFANISLDSNPIVCSKCLPGRYSSDFSTTCMDCDKGRFAAESGQSHICLPCPSGTYLDSTGGTVCLACEIGKYSESSASTTCLECPMNSTTQQIRSSRLQNCICPSGSFGAIPSENGCRACPKYRGMKCGVNSPLPFVERGYWRDPYLVSLVYECTPRESCLESGFSNAHFAVKVIEGKDAENVRKVDFAALKSVLLALRYGSLG